MLLNVPKSLLRLTASAEVLTHLLNDEQLRAPLPILKKDLSQNDKAGGRTGGLGGDDKLAIDGVREDFNKPPRLNNRAVPQCQTESLCGLKSGRRQKWSQTCMPKYFASGF